MTCDVQPQRNFSVLGTRRKFPLVSRKPVRVGIASLVVKVAIQFQSPTQMDYSRTYNASSSLDCNDDEIFTALIHRLEHNSAELLTRKDPTALEGCRGYGDEKPLRYDLIFTLSRPRDTPVRRVFRCFQSEPLTMDDTRNIIISTDYMIGAFLQRHDPNFQWLNGPVRENQSTAQTLERKTFGPASVDCVPQSHFIERTQSFEFIPGYIIDVAFLSASANHRPPLWNKSLRIASRQPTPATAAAAESLMLTISENIQNTLDRNKHASQAIDGSRHSESAVCIKLRICNSLGPSLDHLAQTIAPSQTQPYSFNGTYCQQLMDEVEAIASKARDDMDCSISSVNDLEINVLDIHGPDWSINTPFAIALDSTTIYYQRTVEALLERLQSGLAEALKSTSLSVGLSIHKRGHLILDKMVTPRTSTFPETPKRQSKNKNDIISRLQERMVADIAAVCKDTCSLDQNIQMPNLKVTVPTLQPSRKSSFLSRASSLISLQANVVETSYSPLAKASLLKSHHIRTHSSATLGSFDDFTITPPTTPGLISSATSPQESMLATPSGFSLLASPGIHSITDHDDAYALQRRRLNKSPSPKGPSTLENTNYREDCVAFYPLDSHSQRHVSRPSTPEPVGSSARVSFSSPQPSPRFYNVCRVDPDFQQVNSCDLDNLSDIFAPEARCPQLYRPNSISELLSASTPILTKTRPSFESSPMEASRPVTDKQQANDTPSLTSSDESSRVQVSEPAKESSEATLSTAMLDVCSSTKFLRSDINSVFEHGEQALPLAQDDHIQLLPSTGDHSPQLDPNFPPINLATVLEEIEADGQDDGGQDVSVLISDSDRVNSATAHQSVLSSNLESIPPDNFISNSISMYSVPDNDSSVSESLSSNSTLSSVDPPCPEGWESLVSTVTSGDPSESTFENLQLTCEEDIAAHRQPERLREGSLQDAVELIGEAPSDSESEETDLDTETSVQLELVESRDLQASPVGLGTLATNEDMLLRSGPPLSQAVDLVLAKADFGEVESDKLQIIPLNHDYHPQEAHISAPLLAYESSNAITMGDSAASEQEASTSPADTLAFLEHSLSVLENVIGDFEETGPLSVKSSSMTTEASSENNISSVQDISASQKLSSENLGLHDSGISDYAIIDSSASEAGSEQPSTALIVSPKSNSGILNSGKDDDNVSLFRPKSRSPGHGSTKNLALSRRYSSLAAPAPTSLISSTSRLKLTPGPSSPHQRHFSVLTAGTLGLYNETSTRPSLREMFISGVSGPFHRRRSSMPWQMSNRGLSPAWSAPTSFSVQPATQTLLTNTPPQQSSQETINFRGNPKHALKETAQPKVSEDAALAESRSTKQVSTALAVQRITLHPSFLASSATSPSHSPSSSNTSSGNLGLGLNSGRIRSLSSPHRSSSLGLSTGASQTPHFYLHPSLRQNWKPSPLVNGQ
ncbi:hypothetical protein CFIMG_005550RA [Ceratocystis fimbriata CBS 114723]|uniref:Pt repeat family protein n=1 Tax=Ceratocystis fimbriata CBS 114723 TaxID=1035309 RepID=A0A2C5X523_9PEZI|nr:hypothetical protein CFIMG_005550RA [Ceratocystis fimbriata CBS 114723]